MSTFYLRLTDAQRLPEFVDDEEPSQPLLDFGALNEVNLFVGANNSRKSRLSRHLMRQSEFLTSSQSLTSEISKLQKLFAEIAAELPEDHWYKLQRTTSPVRPEHFLQPIINLPELKHYATVHPTADFLEIRKTYFTSRLHQILTLLNSTDATAIGSFHALCDQLKAELRVATIIDQAVEKTNHLQPHYRATSYRRPVQPLSARVKESLRQAIAVIDVLLTISVAIVKPTYTYIPTLRGSIPLPSVGNTAYRDAVRTNYDITNKNINISTGLDFYNVIKQQRNSPKDTRKKFEAFEKFLSENFFSNKPVDIVALDTQPIIQVWIDGNNDRELHHLGDGIQALIILMYPLFTCGDGEWIFIEEPEVHMHPGFQTLFMRTVLHNDYIRRKKLKLFITTHSNHLLDTSLLSSDVSIFTFTQQGDGDNSRSAISQVEGGQVDILDCLGVANSSVFLAQCGVWVEGITDRLIIEAYLTAYSNQVHKTKFIQDLHYSYLEYAGSNISHYLFGSDEKSLEGLRRIKATAIGNRLWVLADHDSRDNQSKQERHDRLKALNTEHFVYSTTGVREIENTIPWSVLARFVVDVLNIDEAKLNNKGITESDYEQDRLGTFLVERLEEELHGRKLTDEQGSMTTTYKIKLAEWLYKQAMNDELTVEDLKANPAAWQLTESLHKFLVDNCRI